jgi:hypothetical protein
VLGTFIVLELVRTDWEAGKVNIAKLFLVLHLLTNPMLPT